MNQSNYISPDDKRNIEYQMKKFEPDFLWYNTQILNEWFNMAYVDIIKTNKKRREYIRLLCQYLWRHIADAKGITDYSEEIKKLKNMFNIKN